MVCKHKDKCKYYQENSYICNTQEDKKYCGYYRKLILLLPILICLIGIYGVGMVNATGTTKYLVITTPSIVSSISNMTNYRNQTYNVSIEYVSPNYTEIKNLIISYNNTGLLGYVLLVGDISTIPVITSDIDYSDLNGDGVPDIKLGRIPFDNSTSGLNGFKNWSNKIVYFEMNKTYNNKIAGFIAGTESNPPSSGWHTATLFEGSIIPAINSSFVIRKAYYGCGFPECSPDSYFYPNTTADDNAMNLFNSNSLIINYAGHGGNQFFPYYFWPGDRLNLSGNNYNILFAPTCESLTYNFLCYPGNTCGGNKWTYFTDQVLLSSSGGSVAVLGSDITTGGQWEGALKFNQNLKNFSIKTLGEAYLEADLTEQMVIFGDPAITINDASPSLQSNVNMFNCSSDSSIVLCYHFNNDSSVGENYGIDNVTYDYSNSHLNGTYYNASYNTSGGFLGDGAIYFNGARNQINATSPFNLTSDSNFTVNFWLYSNYSGATQYLFSVGNSSRVINFYMGTSGELRLEYYNSTNSVKYSGLNTGIIIKNRWYYVTFVYSNQSINVYRNGRIWYANTTDQLPTILNSKIAFGKSVSQTISTLFNGTLDDIVVYNRSLNSTEVYLNYKTYWINDFGSYVLNTNTSNLSYVIYPNYYKNNFLGTNRTETSILNGLYVNYSFNGVDYFFRPSTGFIRVKLNNTNYYLSDDTVRTIFLSNLSIISNNSSSLLVKYILQDLDNYNATIFINYNVIGDYLKINIYSTDNSTYGDHLYYTGNSNIKNKGIPALNSNFKFFGTLINQGSLFYTFVRDVENSYSNDRTLNGAYNDQLDNSTYIQDSCVYNTLLSGRQVNYNETFYFGVSNNTQHIFDILSVVKYNNTKPKNVLNSSTIINFNDGETYLTSYNRLFNYNNFGMKNIYLWIRGTDNESHPTTQFTAYTGVSGFKSLISNISKFGYYGFIYTDYQDMYNSSRYYNVSRAIINSSGQPIFAWFDSGWGQSLAMKFDYQYEVIKDQEDLINSTGVKGEYVDVISALTAVGSTNDYIDYNDSYSYPLFSTYNGSVRFNILYSNYLIDYLKSKKAFLYGEPFASLTYHNLDYVYNDIESIFPYIPELYLKKVNQFSYLTSDLYSGGSGITDVSGTPTREKMMTHITRTILFNAIGSAYKIVSVGWSNKDVNDFYYLTNYIQKEYSNNNLSITRYYNGTSWLDFDSFIVADYPTVNNSKFPIVFENYTNGLNIYVNKNKTNFINISYSGMNYTIYPNRTLAWNNNTKFFEYMGMIGGINISIVESPDYYYLDSDALITWNFINGNNESYLITQFNFTNSNRINYTVMNNIYNFTFNGTYVLYKLGYSYDYRLNESDILGNARVYNNESIEVDRTIPIWFSQSNSKFKHISSNLTSTINATITFNVSNCTHLETVIYKSNNSNYNFTFNNININCSNNNLTLNNIPIEPALNSNEFNITYDYESIYLSRCNATNNFTVLNFTFMDEKDNSIKLNGTINSALFNYYFDGYPSFVNYYNFTSTEVNTTFPICIYPTDINYYINYSLVYSGDGGYGEKTITTNGYVLYTNITNQIELSLLNSTNIVTFQVINSVSTPISGVYVYVMPYLNDTILTSGYTDSGGIIQFTLQNGTNYRIYFNKSGYDSYSTLLNPTETFYTITLSGTGLVVNVPDDYNSGGSSGGGTITPNSVGVTYSTYPKDTWLTNNTSYNFNMTIDSGTWEFDLWGFNLTDEDNNLLNETSSINSDGGTLSLIQNTSNHTKIIMNFYYTINGNQTNIQQVYLVLDLSDNNFSIKRAIDDTTAYIRSGLFGITLRGLSFVVFFIIFLGAGVLSYKYGVTSPVAICGFVFAMIWLFDISLGWIPSPINTVPHIATWLTAFIFAGFIFKEVSS